MQKNRLALFRQRHFEDQVIVLWVPLVSTLFGQLPRPGRNEGRAESSVDVGSNHSAVELHRGAPVSLGSLVRVAYEGQEAYHLFRAVEGNAAVYARKLLAADTRKVVNQRRLTNPPSKS
jgi:hypothetical protein